MKRFFQFLFMPCEGYTELISASMDTDLTRLDRCAVRIHATFCKGCRQYRKQIMQLRIMLRSVDEKMPCIESMQLDDQARSRLLNALNQEMSNDNRPVDDAD